MRELERVVGVSLSTVTHHLRALEDARSVVGVYDGHYRRYFSSELVLSDEARRLNEEDRRLVAELARPASLAIILNLAAEGTLRHRDIEERLGRTKGAVSHHIARLVELGIIRRTTASGAGEYELSDPSRVMQLASTFAESLKDHVDTFAGLWLSLGRRTP